jgi:hypothetical protein
VGCNGVRFTDIVSLYFRHLLGQFLLKKYEVIFSMIGKVNCYYDAVAGSFIQTRKAGLIHGESYPNRESMRCAAF